MHGEAKQKLGARGGGGEEEEESRRRGGKEEEERKREKGQRGQLEKKAREKKTWEFSRSGPRGVGRGPMGASGVIGVPL